MNVLTLKSDLQKTLSDYKKNAKTIGFVPTMGALHKGHLSLVKRALTQNDCVVVSIFVNPTQFNNATDLEKYPRTLKNDVALLATLSNKIIVFAPEAKAFYEGMVKSKKYRFGGLENEMEGKHRKGHFDGVGTVVSMLLKTVEPKVAYFGEKDFQQLQIIKKLVEIENIPVQIVGCPIVREPNGLAMSSRNKRLTGKQREEAAFIYQTLTEVKEKFNYLSIPKLTKLVANRFKKHSFLKLEYFEIANEKTLKTAKRKQKNTSYRAFIAVYAGTVRLIDNMALN